MHKRIGALRASWCLVAWWVVSAAGAGWGEDLKRFEYTRPEMGVPFTLLFYAPDQGTANAAAEAAFARVEELNRLMSDYDDQSELSRLSRAAPTPAPVPVSDDLWRVLVKAQDLAARSEGAFDITVGPYVRLWRRARRAKQMPSAENLAAAKEAIGYRYLQLDETRHAASLTRPNMRLDLGGIAMGYAVDETLALLAKRGIRRALVNASGDIGAGDPPPGAKGWRVAVASLDANSKAERMLLLANRSATNSGDVYQHVEIDGKRYSHIVDPKTGLGLTDRSGVTVVADRCVDADSLTKVVAVLGPQKGLAFIDATPGAAALMLRPGAEESGPPIVAESKRFRCLPFEGKPAAGSGQ